MYKNVSSFVLFLFHLIIICNSHATLGSSTPDFEDDVFSLPNGGGFWKFPTNCYQDCRIVSWQRVESLNGDSMIKFEVSAPAHGYIAMAISNDSEMGEDDAYICSRLKPESSQFHVYSSYLPKHTQPAMLSTVKDYNATLLGSWITCSFTRPLTVTRNVSGTLYTWNLVSNNFTLLFAEGLLDTSGELSQHTFQTTTLKSYNLLNNQGYRTFTTDLFPQPAVGNQPELSVPVNSEDNIRAVGPSGGKWAISDEDCSIGSAGTCKYVSWRIYVNPSGERMVSFHVVGSATGWVAMAISRDMQMGDDDSYYCTRESAESINVTFRSAYLLPNRPPIPVQQEQNLRHAGFIIEDQLVCHFERPVSVTKVVAGNPMTWDLSAENFNLLLAEGRVGENGELLQHTSSWHTNGNFYLLSNKGYKNPRVPSSTPTPRKEPVALPTGKVSSTGRGGSFWHFPTNCIDCRAVQWQPFYQGENLVIEFKLATRITNGYAGILFLRDLQPLLNGGDFLSVEGDRYMCIRLSNSSKPVLVKGGRTTGQGQITTEPLGERYHPDAFDRHSTMVCSFVRNVSDETGNIDLSNKSYYVLYGEGSTTEDGAFSTPTYNAVTPLPALTITNATKRKAVVAIEVTTSGETNTLKESSSSTQMLVTSAKAKTEPSYSTKHFSEKSTVARPTASVTSSSSLSTAGESSSSLAATTVRADNSSASTTVRSTDSSLAQTTESLQVTQLETTSGCNSHSQSFYVLKHASVTCAVIIFMRFFSNTIQ